MNKWGYNEAKKLLELGEPKPSIRKKLFKPNLTNFNNGVRSITDYPT